MLINNNEFFKRDCVILNASRICPVPHILGTEQTETNPLKSRLIYSTLGLFTLFSGRSISINNVYSETAHVHLEKAPMVPYWYDYLPYLRRNPKKPCLS